MVNPLTRTPLRTTLLGGALALAFTASVDFIGLVTLTSAVNLCVFFTVNLALARLQAVRPRHDLEFNVPRWCPPLGAAICVALLALEFLR